MREIDLTRVLGSIAALDVTGSLEFTVAGAGAPLRGFLVRTGAGVGAYVNCCPHAGHPLNLRPGRFLTPDRGLILCHSHGALFTRDDGLCIAGPCAGQSLTPVPVEVIGDCVLLAEGVDVDRLADAPL